MKKLTIIGKIFRFCMFVPHRYACFALFTCMIYVVQYYCRPCLLFCQNHSANEPQSPNPDAPTPSINHLSGESLPATERSESILHWKRSKSESSLSPHILHSDESPFKEPSERQKSLNELPPGPPPEAPARKCTTPHIDNTLSMQTDLEEDEFEIPKEQESKTEKGTFRFSFNIMLLN